MKNILFILLVLIFLPLKASAANKLFKQLTINEGLAHTDANCITQDSTGLIWIGTNAGLQSYDGYSLQTFDYYSSGQKYSGRTTASTTWLAAKTNSGWVRKAG